MRLPTAATSDLGDKLGDHLGDFGDEIWDLKGAGIFSISLLGEEIRLNIKSPITQVIQWILHNSTTITLAWVKALDGTPGDEAANILAKKRPMKVNKYIPQHHEVISKRGLLKFLTKNAKFNGGLKKLGSTSDVCSDLVGKKRFQNRKQAGSRGYHQRFTDGLKIQDKTGTDYCLWSNNTATEQWMAKLNCHN
ncbi:hypothetical protein AVEN_225081-1 [Araneus ventricosus]|uniref:Uncharacterized protein n=1 Tax=Araneus ventricosus TaxID=182803 RepID=A0A4Y2MU06_ARAVE|nr:hypothetical protein AVEN_225081-1 [Araneus ventricosus]